MMNSEMVLSAPKLIRAYASLIHLADVWESSQRALIGLFNSANCGSNHLATLTTYMHLKTTVPTNAIRIASTMKTRQCRSHR
jgi:hypothetical protein